MRKQLTSSLCLCLLASFILTSCKKDIKTLDSVSTSSVQASIPTYPLTWEGVDLMPTPPGLETVYVPWGSGGSRQIPTEMLDDYKTSDGWKLLYNTFNTSTMQPNWYFMLYNVYRGLVRLYIYIPASANITPSSNITHTLSVEKSHAASSPLMNFAGSPGQIVDVNNNVSFASTLEQWQVARSTWYAVQYEVAYDQNVATQNYNTFDIAWNVGYTSVSTLKVHGTGTGTITGSISIPGTNLSISPTLNLSNSNGNISVSGSSDATKLSSSLGTSLVNSIKGAITSGLSGIVSNLLGGIFKHSSEPTENVHLNINQSFDLSGTLVTPGLLTSPGFAVPGTDQSVTTGFVPANNSRLGVFYISNRPTVKYKETLNRNPPPDYDNGAYYVNNFSVDQTSYSMIYNPDVLAVANIANVKAQVMLETDGDRGSTFWYNNIPDPTLDFPAWDANIQMDGVAFSTALAPVAVRITLDVVPKNGAPAVTLSKTFLANVVKQ